MSGTRASPGLSTGDAQAILLSRVTQIAVPGDEDDILLTQIERRGEVNRVVAT